MHINRIANKVTKSYLMDPYAMLMHYKRAFKLMSLLKKNKAKVLILGNKNQFGIDWKGRFEGMDFDTGIVDEKVISGAPKHYQMILCLDPVLYCRSLHRLNMPVMMCATAREITEHPEILDVTDYLLPSPTSRHDAALRQLIASQLLEEAPAGNSAASSSGSPSEERAEAAAEGTPAALDQGEAQPAAAADAAEVSPEAAAGEADAASKASGEADGARADAAEELGTAAAGEAPANLSAGKDEGEKALDALLDKEPAPTPERKEKRQEKSIPEE